MNKASGAKHYSIFSCIGSIQGAEKECDESRGENISEMRLVDHCPPMIPPDSLALGVFKVLRNCPAIPSILSCIGCVQGAEKEFNDKLTILDHYFDVNRNRK